MRAHSYTTLFYLGAYCFYRMSRRARKTERRNYPSSLIEGARKRIYEGGESKRSVALSLGIPESTLRKHLKSISPPTKLGRYDTTFTKEIEDELYEYIEKIDSMFYGITTKGLRVLAFDFAEKNKIKHRFNKDIKIAGKEWLRGFLKRHPDLSTRQPTSTSIARAIGFNKTQCGRFFQNFSDLMNKHNFPPHAIYNMDETGISTVPNKPPKVLSTKGKRCVNKISSAERGTNITVVCAMSASGKYVPPAFIFARKRMKVGLLDGAPPSSIGMVSDSSFINGDLFLDWLSHFKDHTRPSADSPVLLIFDNHAAHCSLKAVEFFRNNHIYALTLPPHSSHKTQPLDRSFFNCLKKFYAAECEKWLRNHPGRAITPYQVANIFSPAYLKAANAINAIEGFRVTGILPYNPDVFTDEDFLATTVTERPIPEENKENSPPSVSTVTDRFVHEDAEVIDIPSSALSQMSDSAKMGSKDDCNIPNTKILHNEMIAPKVLKITDVAPFPKANLARSSRKSKRSEIISSSRFRKQLEIESGKKVKKPLLKKRPKTSETYEQPKVASKEKIWRCGLCDEVYGEPIKEDWIGCSKCKEWWHEKCTSYLGIGAFVCDFCGE